jgi:hypothetical protein
VVGGVIAVLVRCSLFDRAVAGDASSPNDAGAWTCQSVGADPNIQQTVPSLVSTDMPPNTNVVPVAASDDLQQKIAAALPGDVLELEAGATFTGPFKLPAFNGAGWIVIRTATADATFVPRGTRVSPTDAPKMAKLVAPSSAVVTMANGAGSYRLVGLEIAPATQAAPVDLSGGGVHDVILDRVYTHGGGVVVPGQNIAIVDSYLSGAATNGWAVTIPGAGPLTMINDMVDSPTGHVWIESGSGFVFCRNEMISDGGAYPANFSINGAGNVLVAGSVLSSTGPTLQIQQGNASTANITMAYNRSTRSGAFLQISGPMTNVVVHDNLFDSTPPLGGITVRLLSNTNGSSNVKVDHNTFTSGTQELIEIGQQSDAVASFVFTNNFGPYGSNGVIGSGGDAGGGGGTTALVNYTSSYTFTNNAIWGAPSARPPFPPGNFFPSNEQAVGFDTDWSLLSSSTYKGAGSDGRDVGADIPTLAAATANVAP